MTLLNHCCYFKALIMFKLTAEMWNYVTVFSAFLDFMVLPLSYFCMLMVQGNRPALFNSESLINSVNPQKRSLYFVRSVHTVTQYKSQCSSLSLHPVLCFPCKKGKGLVGKRRQKKSLFTFHISYFPLKKN